MSSMDHLGDLEDSDQMPNCSILLNSSLSHRECKTEQQQEVSQTRLSNIERK